MYSLKEAQAMDYLLKKIQYNGLLEQITENKSELKLVISHNNCYISGDFFTFQRGLIEQNEVNGYEYDKMTYNSKALSTYSILWSLFCEKYLPAGQSYNFKRILDLTVIFEVLDEIVRSVSFTNETIPLRPVLKNIGYFNKNLGPDFLYLRNKEIDIVSIVKREKI